MKSAKQMDLSANGKYTHLIGEERILCQKIRRDLVPISHSGILIRTQLTVPTRQQGFLTILKISLFY
jgi:hypothetical protein